MFKSPQFKKQRELDRDHRVGAEYPHAFRKTWPRKKARLKRKYRHRAKQIMLLSDGMPFESLDSVASEVRAAKPSMPLKKWKPASLREWIAHQNQKREALANRRARREAMLRCELAAAKEHSSRLHQLLTHIYKLPHATT